MRRIVFYEKPGCQNNARQQETLREWGYEPDVRDLLSEPWTEETLRPFFGQRPVSEWFNRASPRVKSGEIVPERVTEVEALRLMLEDHLLIRRPLLMYREGRLAGFNPEGVTAWIRKQDNG